MNPASDPWSSQPSSEELLADARWLRRFAYHLVRDTDVAEDVAQSAWLKALERRPERREKTGQRAWLAHVVAQPQAK